MKKDMDFLAKYAVQQEKEEEALASIWDMIFPNDDGSLREEYEKMYPNAAGLMNDNKKGNNS